MGASRRVRVERGIYRQPNGKYAVCCRRAGRLRFRTVGFDLAAARDQRTAPIAAVESGAVPGSPHLRFDTVAGRWLERFKARVAAGERHPRTLEAHRYQLDCQLLPALAGRRVACIAVNDVAELLLDLRLEGCSAKPCASALATLEHPALRAPARLDHRRPRRPARAQRAPAAGGAPAARARSSPAPTAAHQPGASRRRRRRRCARSPTRRAHRRAGRRRLAAAALP